MYLTDAQEIFDGKLPSLLCMKIVSLKIYLCKFEDVSEKISTQKRKFLKLDLRT